MPVVCPGRRIGLRGIAHRAVADPADGNADSETRYAFERALLNVTRLGITFGGGCSFGHGINISGGPASFALTAFVIR